MPNNEANPTSPIRLIITVPSAITQPVGQIWVQNSPESFVTFLDAIVRYP